MKRMRIGVCLLGIFLAGHPPAQGVSAGSRESPARVLTLEQAVRHALSRHPRVKAARYRLEAGDAGVQAARAPRYPQVNLAEKFNRTNNPMWAFGTLLNQESITQEDFDPDRLNDPDAVNNFNTSISLSWELFSGGRTRAGIDAARQHQKIALVALRQIRQEVIAGTAKAYMGLLLAKENLEVIAQAVETARAHVAFIESRYEEGFVVKSDLLRAKVRLSRLEQEHLTAQSRRLTARAALNAAMGDPDNPLIEAATPLVLEEKPEDSLEEWIEKAQSNHPDLERLGVREVLAETQIAKAKAGHWPSVHLVGAYDWDTESFSDVGDSYTVGAVARLNLYSGGGTRAGVLAAGAALKEAREMKEATRLRITLKTRQAYYEAQSAFKRIAVARSALEQAEEGLRIVENRYRNGLLPLVSLLDAEMARREARVSHFRALHDYQVARVDLMLAAGIIDRRWEE